MCVSVNTCGAFVCLPDCLKLEITEAELRNSICNPIVGWDSTLIFKLILKILRSYKYFEVPWKFADILQPVDTFLETDLFRRPIWVVLPFKNINALLTALRLIIYWQFMKLSEQVNKTVITHIVPARFPPSPLPLGDLFLSFLLNIWFDAILKVTSE